VPSARAAVKRLNATTVEIVLASQGDAYPGRRRPGGEADLVPADARSSARPGRAGCGSLAGGDSCERRGSGAPATAREPQPPALCDRAADDALRGRVFTPRAADPIRAPRSAPGFRLPVRRRRSAATSTTSSAASRGPGRRSTLWPPINGLRRVHGGCTMSGDEILDGLGGALRQLETDGRSARCGPVGPGSSQGAERPGRCRLAGGWRPRVSVRLCLGPGLAPPRLLFGALGGGDIPGEVPAPDREDDATERQRP
jgi:hypothetical protein